MKSFKKRALIRITGIGILHAFLYLWLVPFVLYPRFGDNGLKMTVAVAVLISVALMITLFVGKQK